MTEPHPDGQPDFAPLPIIEGPWNSPVWLIERPLRFDTSGIRPCAVSDCGRPAGAALGDRPKPEDVLCVAHRRRRAKLPKLPSVSEFLDMQSTASPIRKARGAKTRLAFFAPIDFTLVHPRLAQELRYVTSVRIHRNNWRDADYVNKVLRAAIDVGAQVGAVQLSDVEAALGAPDPEWTRRGAETFVGAAAIRNLRLALPQMLRTLEEAEADPWESSVWRASDLGHRSTGAARRSSISWRKVTCPWLLSGIKQLAREDIQSGARAWSTIHSYARAGSVLSAFMDDQAGALEPSELSHQVIIELISWLRDAESNREDFMSVNVLVRLLYRLRETGLQPDLPDTVLLRRGENPVRKTRKPKPFPRDVLERIDTLISNPDVWAPDVQLLMRLFRATGPRASEALELPPDCVTFVTGRGYTLSYYMPKVDDWRRIPLPEQLGRDLVAHQRQVLDKHPDSPYLFPYFGASPRTNVLTRPRSLYSPWPYGAFTNLVWNTYIDAGITVSAQSGEVLTGAQLHRFRHSVATGLLNEGWSQYEVQRFLGHKTPTMMQAYAEIHDDRLRDKYNEYLRNSVGIDGERTAPLNAVDTDVERLRDTMTRATLPNGYCTLPEKQTCSFLPSPCLSCAFFKTTPTFLPIHIRQRDDSLRELSLAKDEGRERAVEAHEQTVERLNTIIDGLNRAVLDEEVA